VSEHRPQATDLSNCDREPIHIPGAIQPHGVLLAVEEPGLTVMQASVNVEERLGRPLSEVLGQPVTTLLDDASVQALREGLALERLEDLDPLRVTTLAGVFDALVHRHQGVLILELEPADLSAENTPHPLRQALGHLQREASREGLLQTIVVEMQRLTGFERVMVYRFDEDGHGMVEAEVNTSGLEDYRGLHYPASDIPRQARDLYLKNWIRSIPDTAYQPVPLSPVLRLDTGAPLDLSFASLRSVSPIHLKYLANMGVRAAMSVSLGVRGALWGLVSCLHHSGAHSLSAKVRSDCELLGRLASLQLSALEDREVAHRRTARQAPLEALVAELRSGRDALEPLFGRPAELLGLVGATGAAVVHDDHVVTAGTAPGEATVRELAGWLDTRAGSNVIASASVAQELPGMEAHRATASGVLSFALPGPVRRRLLWFRPELVQTVSWGGDPNKPVELDAGTQLHPRRSFALWREELRLRSEPWSAGALEAAEDLRRHAVEIDLAKQVEREQRAVRARDDLVAVVSHDLKNPLGVIHMQVAQLRRGAMEDEGERAQRLRAAMDRIQRAGDRMNALVNDLLDLAKIEAGRFELHRQDESVEEVVEEALVLLRPLAEAKHITLEAEVPPAVMVNVDRERVFQVLSNLVGNAIKFTPEAGRVTLHVTADERSVRFVVTDTGPGIPASQREHLFNRYWQAPAKSKAGSGLGLYIAKGIVEAHGGAIWFEPPSSGGASFHFTLPSARPPAR
jgi:light-regulated signal transduction histidine kinase (bacteriophytochrome)